MLTKPQNGWTDFSLGEHGYSLSYVTNVPLEWLERAICGLETLLPFAVCGDCEPGKMICQVELSECRIIFEDNKHRIQDSAFQSVPVSMLDFCKMLHRDIVEHLDDWQKWGASHQTTREDLQLRLDRLEKLIQVKENCFL